LIYSSTVNLPSDTNDFLSTAALTFSPDGSLLMSCHTPGSDYSSITLWDTKTWKVAGTIPTEKSGGGCTAAGFTSDGKHIVRLTQKSRIQPGNTIEVYGTDSWKLIAGVRTFPWYVTNLALPLSGNQIAVAGRMGEVDKAFSSEMSTFQKLALPKASALAVLDLPTLHITASYPLATVASVFGSLAWTADGKSISYASGHGMETFNAHGSERLHYIPALVANAHESIAYTNDGRFLIEAHGSNVDELQIWDQMHSQKLQSIKGQFCQIAVSRDGRYVAAATTGKTIVIE
jgi:WD40 repeat protein